MPVKHSAEDLSHDQCSVVGAVIYYWHTFLPSRLQCTPTCGHCLMIYGHGCLKICVGIHLFNYIVQHLSLSQQKEPVNKSSKVPFHDTMGKFSYNYTLKRRLVLGCFCPKHVFHRMVAFTGLFRVRWMDTLKTYFKMMDFKPWVVKYPRS